MAKLFGSILEQPMRYAAIPPWKRDRRPSMALTQRRNPVGGGAQRRGMPATLPCRTLAQPHAQLGAEGTAVSEPSPPMRRPAICAAEQPEPARRLASRDTKVLAPLAPMPSIHAPNSCWRPRRIALTPADQYLIIGYYGNRIGSQRSGGQLLGAEGRTVRSVRRSRKSP